MIPTSTSQSHDLRQQPLADAARLDEIERKLDDMEELRTTTAIGYSVRRAIFQGRAEERN